MGTSEKIKYRAHNKNIYEAPSQAQADTLALRIIDEIKKVAGI
jgi:hypothetical protein